MSNTPKPKRFRNIFESEIGRWFTKSLKPPVFGTGQQFQLSKSIFILVQGLVGTLNYRLFKDSLVTK